MCESSTAAQANSLNQSGCLGFPTEQDGPRATHSQTAGCQRELLLLQQVELHGVNVLSLCVYVCTLAAGYSVQKRRLMCGSTDGLGVQSDRHDRRLSASSASISTTHSPPVWTETVRSRPATRRGAVVRAPS